MEILNDFFWWMGVIYSIIFIVFGSFALIGVGINYCYGRMKDLHSLTELMAAWKQYHKDKP